MSHSIVASRIACSVVPSRAPGATWDRTHPTSASNVFSVFSSNIWRTASRIALRRSCSIPVSLSRVLDREAEQTFRVVRKLFEGEQEEGRGRLFRGDVP